MTGSNWRVNEHEYRLSVNVFVIMAIAVNEHRDVSAGFPVLSYYNSLSKASSLPQAFFGGNLQIDGFGSNQFSV